MTILKVDKISVTKGLPFETFSTFSKDINGQLLKSVGLNEVLNARVH